jgi:hypothetical protein
MECWSVKRLLSVVLVGAVVFLFVPRARLAHAKTGHSHSLVAKTPQAAVNTYNPVDAPDAVVAIATLRPLAPAIFAKLVRSAPCSCTTRPDNSLWQGRAPPFEPTIRKQRRV